MLHIPTEVQQCAVDSPWFWAIAMVYGIYLMQSIQEPKTDLDVQPRARTRTSGLVMRWPNRNLIGSALIPGNRTRNAKDITFLANTPVKPIEALVWNIPKELG